MLLSLVTIAQAADFSGGGYSFVCADGGRYLNVYAGKDADGTNVCVWERDGSPEQNYTISSCGSGKYKLYPASSSSRVIDVNRGNSYNNPLKAGLNVDLWRTNDAPAQEFYITHVGNNLYKIELAALSDHVLQANNPAKNNGNVTLERYTGASNQHWKILKNDTQVTEPCTHDNISVKNKKTSYEQKNDNIHTVIKTYDKVCNDCGKTIKSNASETTTENHAMSNNKCSKCGYEVIIQKCTHSKTYENVKSYVVAQKDDTYHTVTDTYDVYCSDCDELIKNDLTRTYDEKHTINNDICKKCGYAVPDSEAAQCKHTNTAKHMSENMKSVTSIKDDNQHTTVNYYNLYCVDCQTYIEYDIPEITDEDHKFVDNICSVCNLEKIVEKPASTTIAASKTTVTPGETISLTWPQAERATSYDIHIEKPGVDTPYRIDSGFSGTSGTVVINDEGTYRLTIYPINSAGYIRGGSATVTVKKAATEKTGYVYNTDGSNLNMRSQANTKSSIVTKIPAGSTITVTGDAVSGFYPVKYGNYSGYASSAYITFTKPTNVAANTSYIWPSSGGYLIYVLDYYYGSAGGGSHPTKGGGSIKGAIDIATRGNALATASGTVIETKYGYNSGWGNNVTIRHDDGTYSFYAHLSKINVAVNQKVAAGQAIGVIGTTGNSTGVHLHFEIWDSSKKTIYTIDSFKEKYKKQLVYDGDIVTGGSNSSAIRSWIKNNYKMSGGRWYSK